MTSRGRINLVGVLHLMVAGAPHSSDSNTYSRLDRSMSVAQVRLVSMEPGL